MQISKVFSVIFGWQIKKTYSNSLSSDLTNFIIVFYGLFKMSLCKAVPGQEPELINARSEKPKQLEDKHNEPFKAIVKSKVDVRLQTIEYSLEYVRNFIQALPQTTTISMQGWPKVSSCQVFYFMLSISIAAIALTSFNAYRITQLDAEISGLKTKTDVLLDIAHLHETHLSLLDQNIKWMNQWLTF